MLKPLEGTWPENDPRRAFVAGAMWWEYHSMGGTMWPSDQRLAEAEAERRYNPEGRLNKTKQTWWQSLLWGPVTDQAFDGPVSQCVNKKTYYKDIVFFGS